MQYSTATADTYSLRRAALLSTRDTHGLHKLPHDSSVAPLPRTPRQQPAQRGAVQPRLTQKRGANLDIIVVSFNELAHVMFTGATTFSKSHICKMSYINVTGDISP